MKINIKFNKISEPLSGTDKTTFALRQAVMKLQTSLEEINKTGARQGYEYPKLSIRLKNNKTLSKAGAGDIEGAKIIIEGLADNSTIEEIAVLYEKKRYPFISAILTDGRSLEPAHLLPYTINRYKMALQDAGMPRKIIRSLPGLEYAA